MLATTYPNDNISKHRTQQNSKSRKKGKTLNQNITNNFVRKKIDVLRIVSVRES